MIIDCFLFFDELDLLEIRLHELQKVVDMFLLTESPITFSGLEKPLHFENNKHRFKDFNIVASVCNDRTPCSPPQREKNQKQYNLDYAFSHFFKPGDTIIQGDCDEIPRADMLQEILQDKSWKSARLSMTLFYYYMNCRETGKQRAWKNTLIFRPEGRYEYNAKQNGPVDKVYTNAGWHFSWMGDVQKKLEAWGHAEEYNRPPYNTPEHIRKCTNQGLDLVMRKGRRKIDFEFVEDLGYLPRYVRNNMDKFEKYIR